MISYASVNKIVLNKIAESFFLVWLFITASLGMDQTKSCKQVTLDGGYSENGPRPFTLNATSELSYLIYCEFHQGFGYTYISTTSFSMDDLSPHIDSHANVKVIFLAKDGLQYETTLSTDGVFPTSQLSIKYLAKNSFMPPGSTFNPSLARLPHIKVSISSNEGNFAFKSNGLTVVNDTCKCSFFYTGDWCNPTWKFFLHSRGEIQEVKSNEKFQLSYLKQWWKLARSTNVSLPRNFFAPFETALQGCQGYMTSDDFPEIIGAAVGLKFIIDCGAPPAVNHASLKSTGELFNDVATYTCDENYELTGNNELICNQRGVWVGQTPRCKLIYPRSCDDIQNQYGVNISGEYLIYNDADEPGVVYCDFSDNNIATTFLVVDFSRNLDFGPMDRISGITEVVVRARYTNGSQVESVLAQTDANKNIPIQFSAVRGTRTLALFSSKVRIEPDRTANVTVGYKVNGHDAEAIQLNCCKYNFMQTINFVIFRHNCPKLFPGQPTPTIEVLKSRWLEEAVGVHGDRYIPTYYFHCFNIVFGDVDFNQDDFEGVSGMAIGFRTGNM